MADFGRDAIGADVGALTSAASELPFDPRLQTVAGRLIGRDGDDALGKGERLLELAATAYANKPEASAAA